MIKLKKFFRHIKSSCERKYSGTDETKGYKLEKIEAIHKKMDRNYVYLRFTKYKIIIGNKI